MSSDVIRQPVSVDVVRSADATDVSPALLQVDVLPDSRGDKGDAGTTGDTGPAGPPGQDGTGDSYYKHTQSSPANPWVIPHGLNKFPSLTVLDSSGDRNYGDISYDSPTQVTITFSGAFSGVCYCN